MTQPGSVFDAIIRMGKRGLGEVWTFEQWDELLAPAKDRNFSGPVGAAFERRFKWLEEARAKGWTPEQAELEFDKSVQDSIQRTRELKVQEERDRMSRTTQQQQRGKRIAVEEADL